MTPTRRPACDWVLQERPTDRIATRCHNHDTRMSSNPGISIRTAQPSDREPLARLWAALWPETSVEDHGRELEQLLQGNTPGAMPLIIFVAEADRRVIGFLEADLRSHADGCNPSRPVGYVEGWYVVEEYRKSGAGGNLLTAAENWARSQGCLEMASDTWIDNELSQRVHESLGYEVVDRCVHYRKRL
jgi:aminoglycoside 6'-N-acetyltransferase I